MSTTLRDAARRLRREPVPALLIALILAIGIAAATAIFTVARGVLLRPLPYAQPSALVELQEYQPGKRADQASVAFANLARYQNARGFAAVTAFSYSELVISGDADAERVLGAAVDRDLLRTLNVAPLLGRGIADGDDGDDPARVAVVSFALWRRRFGADPKLLGRSIIIDDTPYTVVGIMPEPFEFPRNAAMDRDVELWIPRRPPPPMMARRGVRDLTVVARLLPGVTEDQARGEMDGLSLRAEAANKQLNGGWRTRVVGLREAMIGRVRPTILLLAVCVGFLLVIAWANASAALLARVMARRQSFGVRLALGADLSTLVALVVAETMFLAVVATAIALPLSAAVRGALVRIAPVALPRQEGILLDARSGLFAVAVAVGTALVSAVGPAFWLRGANASELLADAGRTAAGSRSRTRVLAVFVAGQLMLATVLIASTATLYGHFIRLNRVDPGFTTQNIFTATIPLRGMRYRDAASRARLTDQLLTRIRAIPGVERASVATLMPMSGGLMSGSYQVGDGNTDSTATAVLRAVSTDFFATLGIPVIEGRAIGAGDDENAVAVAVVNRAFARQTFGARAVIGNAVTITPPGADAPQPFRIVGVVGDAKEKDLLGPSSPIVYFSDHQASFPHTALAVRTRGSLPLVAIRGAVHDLDPSLALADVSSLASRVRSTYSLQFFLLNILATFAVSAGLLIAVGVYGSVSFAVNADLKGIGVRMALGATRARVLGSLLWRTSVWSAIGATLGLATSAAVGRLAGTLGVSAEPVMALLGALTAIGLAIVATWVPAWRASGTDPVVVLKA